MTAPTVTVVKLVDKKFPTVGIYAQIPSTTPGGDRIRCTVGYAHPSGQGWRVRIISGRCAGLVAEADNAVGARQLLLEFTAGVA